VDLVTRNISVPCVDGVARRYVDLDYAASTPALQAVADTVEEFLPWYASVHRGHGYRSLVAMDWFEEARQSVARFVDARDDDVVVFVANTTDATNLLSAALTPGSRILGSPAEHHANLLPWRVHRLELLPFTDSPAGLVEACREALTAGRGEIRLVALSGASNVTGEIAPIVELAAVAHEHGAELFVDAAQLAPHRPVSLAGSGVDYVAFSGHKLYAPYGSGALVGRREGLRDGEPFRKGGGAATRVGLDGVQWAEPPARYEAGSPNVVGAVALGAACRALGAAWPEIVTHERAIAQRLHEGLDRIEGLRRLRQWPVSEALGVASFTLRGYEDDQLATILAAEWAIGVRQGRFCAHPLVEHLTGASSGRRTARDRPVGAVRASTGLGTRPDDVDALVDALRSVVAEGPRWRYSFAESPDRWSPVPDPRPTPSIRHAA